MKPGTGTAILLMPFVILGSGCGPKVSFTQLNEAPVQASEECHVDLLPSDEESERETVHLGTINVGDSGLSLDCGLLTVFQALFDKACDVGANLFQVTEVKSPNLWTTCWRVTAEVYAFSGPWKSVQVSEDSARSYLDANLESLDPMEGIWSYDESTIWHDTKSGDTSASSDPMAFRLAILSTDDFPSYEFVGVVLESDCETWKEGDVKLLLRRTADPMIYECRWYGPAFVPEDLQFLVSDFAQIKTVKAGTSPIFPHLEYVAEMVLRKTYPTWASTADVPRIQ